MSEATAIRIANVKYAGTGLQLIVRWTNNQEMTVNLEGAVYRLKGLRALLAQAVFARAGVGEDGCSVVWPGDIDMGADRLWEMALEQNGHADAAEAAFRNAIAGNPAIADAWFDLGLLAMQAERTEEARRDFVIAVTLAPTMSKGLRNLAALEALAGNRDAALAWLARAMALQPDDPGLAKLRDELSR